MEKKYKYPSTQIRIDPELWRKFRRLALEEGKLAKTKLTEVLQNLVEQAEKEKIPVIEPEKLIVDEKPVKTSKTRKETKKKEKPIEPKPEKKPEPEEKPVTPKDPPPPKWSDA